MYSQFMMHGQKNIKLSATVLSKELHFQSSYRIERYVGIHDLLGSESDVIHYILRVDTGEVKLN